MKKFVDYKLEVLRKQDQIEELQDRLEFEKLSEDEADFIFSQIEDLEEEIEILEEVGPEEANYATHSYWEEQYKSRGLRQSDFL